MTPSSPGIGFEFPSSVITGFAYSDAVDSVIASTRSVSMYRPVVNANFTPLAGQGTTDAVDLELDRRHHDLNVLW